MGGCVLNDCFTIWRKGCGTDSMQNRAREMARSIGKTKLEGRWENMAEQTLLEQECGSVGGVCLLSICKALSLILIHNCSHPVWVSFHPCGFFGWF